MLEVTTGKNVHVYLKRCPIQSCKYSASSMKNEFFIKIKGIFVIEV